MQTTVALPSPTHAFEEHTGEVLLSVRAPTLPELYAEAGRALAELMADEPPGPPDPAWKELVVRAPDREALLVEWLNELLYRGEVEHRLYADLHVDLLTNHELRARVRGWAPSRQRTAVKAATYHQLQIREAPGGFAAELVLDV